MSRLFPFPHRICESFFLSPLVSIQDIANNIGSLGEYRHDLSLSLSLSNIEIVRQHINSRLIFTCRSIAAFTFHEQEAFYTKALQLGYDYIDLDFEDDKVLLESLQQSIDLQQRLILSRHFFDGMPSDADLDILIKNMQTHPAYCFKIAVKIDSLQDLERLKRWQSQWQHIMFVGMGKYALEYRAWSLVYTATPFTYAAFSPETSTVAQQPNAYNLQQKVSELLGKDYILATVIGASVQHSQSPQLFEAYSQKHDLQNAFYHKKNLAKASAIPQVMATYTAFNITAPYKQAVIHYLDHISPAATAIGAVNTAYKKEEQWYGDNTDYIGILESVKPYLSAATKVLIIGAGGAARAAAYAMQIAGMDIHIINRTWEKAKDLAFVFHAEAIKDVSNINDYQLIINTIPEIQTPIAHILADYQGVVLDAIYPQSVVAPYLQHPKAVLIKGEVWLAAQAEAAFALF